MYPIVLPFIFFKFQILEKTRSSPCFYACDLHVLCIAPMLIIHPHIGKHDAGGGNHGYLRWNVHLVEMFLHGNKINFIHSITNFYAMSAPKTFMRILTGDSMHPIGHHVPWFKFQILEKDEIIYMFLCSRSQVSMRRRKRDVGGGNHGCARWNIHIAERFLRRNEIIFYSSNH